MDVQAAVRFISSHGDPIEQARLRFTMSREPAPQQAVAALLAGQRGDGGWAPFWAADYSSLDATCFRLAQADQLGIDMQEPGIQRAVQFIEDRQASPGSWEEDAAVASFAPPWASPGNLAAQLYLTSNCGYWIALLREASQAAKLASSFLLPHLPPSGQMPSFLHTHWLSGGLWVRLGSLEPAEVVFSHLMSVLPELHFSNLAWMVTALCRAGLAKSHELVRGALDRLVDGQQPDGRWVSEDGPARDVHATLEALLAIKMAGYQGL